MVQSRIKSLEKMEKKDKLVAIKDLEFAFTEKPFHHKYAMTLDGVTFGYEPGKPLDPELHPEHRRPRPRLRHREEREGQDDPPQAHGRGPRARARGRS